MTAAASQVGLVGCCEPFTAATMTVRCCRRHRGLPPPAGGSPARRRGARLRVACGTMSKGRRFSYSRWDGTQVGFDIDADSVFKSITDDLLYHGDLNAALRRLMQQGFRDRDGKQLQGLRDVLERL